MASGFKEQNSDEKTSDYDHHGQEAGIGNVKKKIFSFFSMILDTRGYSKVVPGISLVLFFNGSV